MSPSAGAGRAGRTGRASVVTIAPAAVVALLGLLVPLATVAGQGIPLVGMTEESTGYRYFYSLRILYTPDERPWLPQGQTMGVVHLAIQALLTAVGFPPTQIRPRIDVFGVVAAALPILLTAVALAWAVRPLPGPLPRLAVALALVVISLDPAMSNGYHLLLPDYQSWIHVVAMISLGLCLRLTEPAPRPPLRAASCLGLFAGLALALKVTMLTFVVPPAILLAVRWWPSWRLVIGGALGTAIAGVTLVGTTLLYFRGSLDMTAQFFRLLVGFGSSVAGDNPATLWEWLGSVLVGDEPLTRLAALLPAALGLGALALRPRTVSVALLAGSALSLAVLWRRHTGVTMIESYDLALVATVAWLARVGVPAVRSVLRRGALGSGTSARLATAAGAGAVLLLAGFAAQRISLVGPALLPAFAGVADLERAIDRFTAESPGAVAVLTLDNGHNPLTLDSAIFKGGTNVAETSVWGASPYVAGLVPDRWYFTYSPLLRTPIDLAPYSSLLFVSHDPPGQLDRTLERLTERFGASFHGFECPLVLPRPGPGLQYGCRRRPDAAVEEREGPIRYAPSSLALGPDAPVEQPGGPARPLRSGEAVYTAASREIWRRDAAGTFTRLVGRPGQTVLVESLGGWAGQRDATTGLPATFDAIHWTIDSPDMRPANRNPGLGMEADGALRGWTLLDARDRTTIERGRNGTESWLELRPRVADSRPGVRASLDLSKEELAPVSAVVSVRAFGGGRAVVRLDARGAPVVDRLGSVTWAPGTGEWQSLVVSLPAGQSAGRPELTIELVGGRPGERLDVRRAEIHVGRYP